MGSYALMLQDPLLGTVSLGRWVSGPPARQDHTRLACSFLLLAMNQNRLEQTVGPTRRVDHEKFYPVVQGLPYRMFNFVKRGMCLEVLLRWDEHGKCWEGTSEDGNVVP